MSSDLKPRSIKISDATWVRWQVMAGHSGVSVTALITQSVDGYRAALDRVAEMEARAGVLEREAIAGRPKAREAMNLQKHHAAGPVHAEVMPRNLSGEAVGYRPKAGWKGDK